MSNRPKDKVGVQVYIYVDEDGVPTGESYLQCHGRVANRLGDNGLHQLNALFPWATIHATLLKLIQPPDERTEDE